MLFLKENVIYLLDKYKTNPNKLSKQHPEIQQSTIFRVKAGLTKEPHKDTMLPFANWANVDIDDLYNVDLEAREKSDNYSRDSDQLNLTKTDGSVDLKIIKNKGKLPVLSIIQAGKWTSLVAVENLSEIEEWLDAIQSKDSGKNDYYLKVQGPSMSPYFLHDDYIRINPDIPFDEVQHGQLVVVICDGEGTFKKLVRDGSKCLLEALNKDWKPRYLEINERCRYLGRVIGQFRHTGKYLD